VYYALLGTVDCRFWGRREMTEHGREEDLFSFVIVCRRSRQYLIAFASVVVS
jgi:hypothetical protein